MITYVFNLFVIVLYIAFVSCTENKGKLHKVSDANEINYNYNDWLNYIESTESHLINSNAVDSIVIYYINDDAPSVVGIMYVLYWKNGQILTKNDCLYSIDGYFQISDEHFIFYTKRKKSIHLNNVLVHDSLVCSGSRLIDVSDFPCAEIYDLKKDTVIKNIVYLKAKIIDICFDEILDTSLLYQLYKLD